MNYERIGRASDHHDDDEQVVTLDLDGNTHTGDRDRYVEPESWARWSATVLLILVVAGAVAGVLWVVRS
jgi:hypothetical protein